MKRFKANPKGAHFRNFSQ